MSVSNKTVQNRYYHDPTEIPAEERWTFVFRTFYKQSAVPKVIGNEVFKFL